MQLLFLIEQKDIEKISWLLNETGRSHLATTQSKLILIVPLSLDRYLQFLHKFARIL